MSSQRPDFHTYHIFRWLTGCPELRKRYLEICHDTRIGPILKRQFLESFVRDMRDSLCDLVDWDQLIEKGKAIEPDKKTT